MKVEFERSGRSFIEVLSRHFLGEESEEDNENEVKVACFPAEIRTHNLQTKV
jgi:hypothetical protein